MGDSRRELRDRRLLGEYKELMEFSARSPLVKIEQQGQKFPPTEYLVTYDCVGYTDSSQKRTTTGHKVRITLPERYPQAPPIFQYESNVWSPRFFGSYTASEHGGKTIRNYICIGHVGRPDLPLRTFVIAVGHMIQLRRDAGDTKPVDTRSLEGPDFSDVEERILVSESSQVFDIVVLENNIKKNVDKSGEVSGRRDDNSDDDLDDLIHVHKSQK